jgi:YesN/AraC family two-component response regulator
MYIVYFVDDEPLVLEDMKRSIPWQEYGFFIAGVNSDPQTAREEILAIKPEAVFTDIKMPRLTGLELIATLRTEGIESEFVAVSAYEDFHYARKLLLYGGFDYLVKPVERKQYHDLLTRLKERLDARHGKNLSPVTTSEELNRILLYLNRGLSHKHSLSEVAAMFNISTWHVCNLFSNHMHTTLSADLTRIRMEAAARLLTVTDTQVKAVARETGYEDYFYFCRVFRDYFSCTPSQYRNER